MALLDFYRTTDAFAKAEPEIERLYDFTVADRRFGVYARAVKATVCNEVNKTLPLGIARPKTRHMLRNLVIACAIAVATVGLILRSARRRVHVKNYDVMCDGIHDAREIHIYRELVDLGQRMIVVGRDERGPYRVGGHDSCIIEDGSLTFGEALNAAQEACRAIGRIAWHARSFPPPVFTAAVKLPWHRMAWRALFSRYRPKAFWARDDYTPAHIMRHLELADIEARHVGVCHGIPTSPSVVAQRRWISFDSYLVGSTTWAALYKDRWPESMQVHGVTPFGVSRKHLAQFTKSEPRTIAVFIKDTFQNPEMISFIGALASMLPRWTIFLKPKTTNVLRSRQIDGNIKLWSGDAYSLIEKATVVLSDPSHVVLEALQLGRPAYYLFLSSAWRSIFAPNPMRLHSAERAAMEIVRIGRGGAYPFHEMIEFFGRPANFWYVALDELGVSKEQIGKLTLDDLYREERIA